MWEEIIGRSHYRQKHLDAPLLCERTAYLQHWIKKGRAKTTLKSIATYLLRIIEFLNLTSPRIVTLKEIEEAANAWASHQSNHPQKKIEFSQKGKERFTWYAIDWLKTLNWLESPPEEQAPLFNKIFKKNNAFQRHLNAPLLKERLMYLQKWTDEGATLHNLRFIAYYLLAIIGYLKLDKTRMIYPEEIKKAAEKWAASIGNAHGKRDLSSASLLRFESIAINWLHMLGWLHQSQEKVDPFLEYIIKYMDYMHQEKLSEEIIYSFTCSLKDFFKYIEPISSLQQINTSTIEDVINKKTLEVQNKHSVQAYTSVLQTFFTYAEEQKWCQPGLAQSIKTSQVYRQESLPQDLACDDIKKLLEMTEGDLPTNIRDRAIIMLLAFYGLRCKEISRLCFEDIDWENEMLCIKRSNTMNFQKFPLSQIVKNAILLYLLKIRPTNCSCKEVFVTRQTPYRPLTSAAIFCIVSKRLKPLKLNLKHHGPHTLRQACATRLIKEDMSLKEISDHLGYVSVESSFLYNKVDLNTFF